MWIFAEINLFSPSPTAQFWLAGFSTLQPKKSISPVANPNNFSVPMNRPCVQWSFTSNMPTVVSNKVNKLSPNTFSECIGVLLLLKQNTDCVPPVQESADADPDAKAPTANVANMPKTTNFNRPIICLQSYPHVEGNRPIAAAAASKVNLNVTWKNHLRAPKRRTAC
jgi:hypothetical protein